MGSGPGLRHPVASSSAINGTLEKFCVFVGMNSELCSQLACGCPYGGVRRLPAARPRGWNPSSAPARDRAGPGALRCRPLRGRVRGEVPPAVPGGRRHRLGCVHREVLGADGRVVYRVGHPLSEWVGGHARARCIPVLACGELRGVSTPRLLTGADEGGERSGGRGRGLPTLQMMALELVRTHDRSKRGKEGARGTHIDTSVIAIPTLSTAPGRLGRQMRDAVRPRHPADPSRRGRARRGRRRDRQRLPSARPPRVDPRGGEASRGAAASLVAAEWQQARKREPPSLRSCWSSGAPDGLRSRDLRLDRAVRTAGLLYGRVCYSVVCPQRDSNPCRRLERAKS